MIHTTIWMLYASIALCYPTGQSQKVALYHFIYVAFSKRQKYSDKKQFIGYQGLGVKIDCNLPKPVYSLNFKLRLKQINEYYKANASVTPHGLRNRTLPRPLNIPS